VFGLGLLGTGARLLSIKPRYRSEATVVYEPGPMQAEAEPTEDLGQLLRQMLTSGPRLQRLIEEMHLYPTVVGGKGLPGAVEVMRGDVKMAVREGPTFGVSYDADDRDRARAVLTRLLSGVVDDDARRRQHQVETMPIRLVDTPRGGA